MYEGTSHRHVQNMHRYGLFDSKQSSALIVIILFRHYLLDSASDNSPTHPSLSKSIPG